jgi:tetratricopeptide (TPR) repeat protein
MRFGAIWLAVVAMLSAAPAYALDQRDLKNCDQSADWDRKIAGCTKLLTEPRFPPDALSTIYAARGTGWVGKNDFARGIVDFDESLRLNPKNLVALSNRGAAWLLRGDTTRALADLDAAIGLIQTIRRSFPPVARYGGSCASSTSRSRISMKLSVSNRNNRRPTTTAR